MHAEAQKLRMAWQTGDVNIQLSYALATQKFAKAGLDVELVAFPSGPAILPALAAKQIDVAWMGQFPAVTGYANQLPIKLFMIQLYQKSSTRLIVNPKSGIATLKDLKGKKIGIAVGSTSHQHGLRAVEQAGLTPNDVTFVNLAPANMAAAYVAGQIDAAVVWEPTAGEIEKAGGKSIATTESLGLMTASVAVVRTEYLRDNPAVIQKLLQVWDEARQDFYADTAKTSQSEAKRVGQSEEEFASLYKRMGATIPSYPEQLSHDYFGKGPDGKPGLFVADLNNIARFLLQLNRIQSIPDLTGLVDTEPIATYVKAHSKQ
jgi:aliphatic sulfonates family ABC transporter substrate-binding protein